MNNYYAAVDKDGGKWIYSNRPNRYGPEWREKLFADIVFSGTEIKGFPDITWDDEPVKVKLTIEVVV